MKFEYDLIEMEETIGGSLLDDLRALVEVDTGIPTSFDDGDVLFAMTPNSIVARITATKALYQIDLDTEELDDVDWDSLEWKRTRV